MSDGKKSADRTVGRCESIRRGGLHRVLAARQPGGTGWGRGEVPMWQRSEVERLTGLSRHAIQDLCNQNTARDGLGFWVPAVSKPGYARYDEGDLLAFYLVRQLTKAGFTLAEVEPVALGMLEDDAAFERALQCKGHRLGGQRDAVLTKMRALECLEDAAASAPEDRLYAIMGEVMRAHADDALRAAFAEVPLEGPAHDRVRRRFMEVVEQLLDTVQGNAPSALQGRGDTARGARSAAPQIDTYVQHLRALLESGASPVGAQGGAFVWAFAADIAAPDGRAPQRRDGAARAAVFALAAFCAAADNGVPIELVFGNGSFAFLAQATSACAADIHR